MFFIISLISVDSYMPPNREPVGEGKNPITVTRENSITANLLIDLFFSGFHEISAIRIRRAETVSNNSWRIIKKLSRLI
jgi:hypothetical protein